MRVVKSIIAVLVITATTLIGIPEIQAAVEFRTLSSAGPLTNIDVGRDLSCQVQYKQEVALQFFPTSARPGDCGTFLAVGGKLYAPDFRNHAGTATGGLGSYTPFTPVSQSAVTGAGTAADPVKVITTVAAGTSGLTVVESDTYVPGRESYFTDVVIKNSNVAATAAIVYRGADCFLGGSDSGYGAVNATNGSVACTKQPNNSPADRVEQWVPVTGGNSWYEARYSEVWTKIATQNVLPATCRCNEGIDNGAVIAWSVSVPAGGQVNVAHLTNFSSNAVATKLEAKAVIADVNSSGPATSAVWAPYLTATLSTSAGAAISGRAVDFYSGGQKVCSTTTGADGVGRCSDPTGAVLVAVGSHDYRAVFSGDNVYLASAGDAGLTTIK